MRFSVYYLAFCIDFEQSQNTQNKSKIKQGRYRPRLHVCMAATLGCPLGQLRCRTRLRAIPLAMITMRKSIHWFPIWVWGSALRPFETPELRYNNTAAVNSPLQVRAEPRFWYDDIFQFLGYCCFFISSFLFFWKGKPFISKRWLAEMRSAIDTLWDKLINFQPIKSEHLR